MQNALKFTFQGKISVTLSYDYNLGQLNASIKDTGMGISNQDRCKLFKMFGKLSETAHVNTSGIGLGLNICQKIVQMFEGEIYLED